MRLAQKFTLALVVLVFAVLSVRAFYDAQRIVKRHLVETIETHHELAEITATAVERIWQQQGWEAALAFLDDVGARRGDTTLRWIWLTDDAAPEFRPHAELATLRTRLDDELVVDLERDGVVITYRIVTLPDLPAGAIEFARTTEDRDASLTRELATLVVANLVLVLLYALLATRLGDRLVGRPIAELVAHARRVGEGRFDEPARVYGQDEIGELAREMNTMADHLAAERARAEREYEARVAVEAQLAHADRLATVGRLSAAIVHDVATPLNVILGRAAMIVDGDVPPEGIVPNAEKITQQTERITKMIRSILDLSRNDDARARAPVNLEALVEETIELIRPLARKANVETTIDPSSTFAPCRGNAQQLLQVLTNVATNAIQAMPAGGNLRFFVGSGDAAPNADAPEQRIVYVEVEDDGPGIPEEHREDVFQPFFTTKPPGEGTGLGLGVCQHIAKEHAGWMQLDSEVGRGTKITLFLPRDEEPT